MIQTPASVKLTVVFCLGICRCFVLLSPFSVIWRGWRLESWRACAHSNAAAVNMAASLLKIGRLGALKVTPCTFSNKTMSGACYLAWMGWKCYWCQIDATFKCMSLKCFSQGLEKMKLSCVCKPTWTWSYSTWTVLQSSGMLNVTFCLTYLNNTVP